MCRLLEGGLEGGPQEIRVQALQGPGATSGGADHKKGSGPLGGFAKDPESEVGLVDVFELLGPTLAGHQSSKYMYLYTLLLVMY